MLKFQNSINRMYRVNTIKQVALFCQAAPKKSTSVQKSEQLPTLSAAKIRID